jgi:hypothetical protein
VPWAAPQHAFRFGRALESCFGYLRHGHRIFLAGGEVVAGIPFARFAVGGPFRALYSQVFDIYGGPVIVPERLHDTALLRAISDDIDEQANRLGAFEARICAPVGAPEAVGRCLRMSPQAVSVTRECPFLRRALRRSEQAGVRVEVEAPVGRLRGAYPLYAQRMRAIGGTAKPWRFLEALAAAGLAVPFVADREGRPLGLVVLLVCPRMAVYWVAGTDVRAAALRPMNALVDAAIRWCHGRGIPLFSFGESFGGRPGLVRFKRGWGPTGGSSTVTLRTYRPWVQRTWRLLEPLARRGYAAWDGWRRPAA